MTNIFVLFIWLYPGSSAGVTFTAEFMSEQACHSAAQEVKVKMYAKAEHLCVRKF